jgi:hypothetical protein
MPEASFRFLLDREPNYAKAATISISILCGGGLSQASCSGVPELRSHLSVH